MIKRGYEKVMSLAPSVRLVQAHAAMMLVKAGSIQDSNFPTMDGVSIKC